jgi:hypothetical protein
MLTSATTSGLILDGGRLDLFEDESITTLKQRYCSELAFQEAFNNNKNKILVKKIATSK